MSGLQGGGCIANLYVRVPAEGPPFKRIFRGLSCKWGATAGKWGINREECCMKTGGQPVCQDATRGHILQARLTKCRAVNYYVMVCVCVGGGARGWSEVDHPVCEGATREVHSNASYAC